MSYIATDASARGGGGNRPEAVGFGAGAGTGGVGGAVAAPSYAVPLYDAAPSNGRPACGYYPYPRCRTDSKTESKTESKTDSKTDSKPQG